MWWDLHTDNIGPSLGEVCVNLRLREFAVSSVIARRELRSDLALPQSLQLFRRLKRAVGGPVFEKQFDVFAIDVRALRLAIRSVGATDIGALVPREAEPMQRVEDHLLGGRDEAGAVRVLNAEDKFAVALFGVEIVDEADVGGAYVGVACW